MKYDENTPEFLLAHLHSNGEVHLPLELVEDCGEGPLLVFREAPGQWGLYRTDMMDLAGDMARIRESASDLRETFRRDRPHTAMAQEEERAFVTMRLQAQHDPASSHASPRPYDPRHSSSTWAPGRYQIEHND